MTARSWPGCASAERRWLRVECLDERGDPLTINARAVVVAANGIENPAILLRSGLDGPDVGRWLFDHAHRLFEIELDRNVGAGRGIVALDRDLVCICGWRIPSPAGEHDRVPAQSRSLDR